MGGAPLVRKAWLELGLGQSPRRIASPILPVSAQANTSGWSVGLAAAVLHRFTSYADAIDMMQALLVPRPT